MFNEIEKHISEDTEIELISCTEGIKGKIAEIEYLGEINKDPW